MPSGLPGSSHKITEQALKLWRILVDTSYMTTIEKTTLVARSSRLFFGPGSRQRCKAEARRIGVAQHCRPDGSVVRYWVEDGRMRQQTWPAARVQIIHDILREVGQ